MRYSVQIVSQVPVGAGFADTEEMLPTNFATVSEAHAAATSELQRLSKSDIKANFYLFDEDGDSIDHRGNKLERPTA